MSSPKVHAFQFVQAKKQPSGNEYWAEVPTGLTATDSLLQTLYDQLTLPGYFGFTWDGLSDCLRDFHWLKERTIVVRHQDLPALPEAEVRTYLEVLAEAVQSWQSGDEHELRVEFPMSARAEVVRVLSEVP